MNKPEIFISYAWGNEGEELVQSLVKVFKTKGYNIIYDKADIKYKESIKRFMERIGKGKFIIIVLSAKYLKSPNCMYEMLEIKKNKNFLDRIFPIVMEDTNIYTPEKQLDYVKFWDNEIELLNKEIKSGKNLAHINPIFEKLNLYTDIRNFISGIISFISDMNTYTPAKLSGNDFKIPCDEIDKQIYKPQDLKDYNINNIINLLNEVFNDTELLQFCISNYDEVYKTFTNGMDKTQKILRLVDYSKRHL